MTLTEVAARRHALHENHPTHRPLSDGYEEVGLAGEAAFAAATGLEIDTEDRPGGDAGRDFILPLTIDVKTARKAFNLIVEVGHVNSDIYVLAEFKDGKAEMVGWAWGKELRSRPTRDFGHGVNNHFIPREELRPMGPLLRKFQR
jgi:hypothetical protein